MNQINGRAWVDALRSGKYVQGMHALRQTTGQGNKDIYCCLGVVTELAVAAGVLPAGVLREDTTYYYYLADETGAQTCGKLPQSVGKWLEIDEYTRFLINGRTESAVRVNDILGYSFSQIADLIEAQYLQPTNSDESN